MMRKRTLSDKKNFWLSIYLSCATMLRSKGQKISDHGPMSAAVKEMQDYIFSKHHINARDFSDWALPVQDRMVTKTIKIFADRGCPVANIYMQIMYMSLPYVEDALPETDEYVSYERSRYQSPTIGDNPNERENEEG